MLRGSRRAPTRAAMVALFVASIGLQAIAPGSVGEPRSFISRKFASVPEPGQPWGMVLDRGRALTSTGGAYEAPLDDWHIFAFDERTARLSRRHSVVIPRLRPVSLMGLASMAFDARRRLYVADMNGRVLRVDLQTKRVEVYATIPVFSTADFVASMPFDIAFDRSGNLYVADGGSPIVYRVRPGPAGRQAEPWLQDIRFQGQPMWGGLHSIALAPNGGELFFGMCQYKNPDGPIRSIIFRVPVTNPSSATVREFHRYPGPSSPACPNGLAFGRSGKLYVALTTADAIQILKPNGKEERRFGVDAPNGIALDGKGNLFIASMDTDTLFKAFVRDVGHRLVTPKVP
jgi:hypothetical protein